jgi:hypothetical protein
MNTKARLDEASARKIAAGRLAAIHDRIVAALEALGPLPAKPLAREQRMTAVLREAFGNWLLSIRQSGRKTAYLVAQPSDPDGWIAIVLWMYNTRSERTQFFVLASISAHATARLLERRRDVNLERILEEELGGAAALIEFAVRFRSNKLSDEESRQTSFTFSTTNGEFRLTRDGDSLVATTWVPKKTGA